MQEFEEAAIRQTVEDVKAAMFAASDVHRSWEYLRGHWPAGCCEFAAVVIAAILEERALGTWLMVSGHRPEEVNGHSWLVKKDAAGLDLFSIDVTIAQFRDLATTEFVDAGPSPSRECFTDRVKETSVWDWPYLYGDDGPYRPLIKQVQRLLAAA